MFHRFHDICGPRNQISRQERIKSSLHCEIFFEQLNSLSIRASIVRARAGDGTFF